MPAPNPIRALGTILAPTGPRTYRTALPNGKEIIAHLRPRLAAARGPRPPLTQVPGPEVHGLRHASGRHDAHELVEVGVLGTICEVQAERQGLEESEGRD